MTNEDLISDLRKSLNSSELNQLQMLSSKDSKSLKDLREETVKSYNSRNSQTSKKSVKSLKNKQPLPQSVYTDSPLKKLRSSKLKPVNLLEVASEKSIKSTLDAPRLAQPSSSDSKRSSEEAFSQMDEMKPPSTRKIISQ